MTLYCLAQACRKNSVVVKLPKACQLSYGGGSDPALLSLIDKVPQELWGARLALQVPSRACAFRSLSCSVQGTAVVDPDASRRVSF